MTVALNELVALEVRQEEVSIETLSYREFLMFVNFDAGFTGNKILLDATNYQDELPNIDPSSQPAINTWFLFGGKKLQVWRFISPLPAPPECLGNLADISLVSEINETLNGDGSYTAGERILLTAQVDEQENGVWVVNAGAWTRDPNADTVAKIQGFCILNDVNNIEYYISVDDSGGGLDAGALVTVINRTVLLEYEAYKDEFLDKTTPRQMILGINSVDLISQEAIYTSLISTELVRLDLLPRYYYLAKRSFTATTTLDKSRFLSFVYDSTNQNVWAKYLTNLDDFGVYKNADFVSLSSNLGTAEGSSNFELQVVDKQTGILDNIETKPASVTYFINMVDSEGVDITANFIREDLAYSIRVNVLNALLTVNADGTPLVVKNNQGLGIINSKIRASFAFLELQEGSQRINNQSITIESLPIALQNEVKTLKDFKITYEYIQQVNRVKGRIDEVIAGSILV